MSGREPGDDVSGAAPSSTGAADVTGAKGDANDSAGAARRDLDGSQARLAYSIMRVLLEHTRVTGDLVALMAQTLDEDTLKSLTATPHWAAYLDSRRALSRAREDMEQFARVMNELGES
ncbi:MAG: hypothetical protein LC785_14715 [Acidobacteria bacterium]|nr:hypothetical protein [Acidobacteriota bacterium]MCA1643164.1 hypothetical protein [Acidobacteriota bacterium]